MSDPQNLRELGERLDEAQKRLAPKAKRPAPTQMGIAFRFATELVAALVVGGALGWGLDWAAAKIGLHTKPVLLILFVVLGATAGIRNVVRAAGEINADIAGKGPAPSVQDDEES